jgi:hypothetical protein
MVNQKRTQRKVQKRVFKAHRHVYRSITACKGVGIYHLTVTCRTCKQNGSGFTFRGYQILDTKTKKPLTLKVFNSLVEARQAAKQFCDKR